jgi:hypothetical protein
MLLEAQALKRCCTPAAGARSRLSGHGSLGPGALKWVNEFLFKACHPLPLTIPLVNLFASNFAGFPQERAVYGSPTMDQRPTDLRTILFLVIAYE